LKLLRVFGILRGQTGFLQIHMDAIPSDTTVEAARKQLEILRSLDMSARANITFQLSNNLRQTVEAGVRHRHPDYNEQQIKSEVLRLMVGERLFREVFGDAEAHK